MLGKHERLRSDMFGELLQAANSTGELRSCPVSYKYTLNRRFSTFSFFDSLNSRTTLCVKGFYGKCEMIAKRILSFEWSELSAVVLYLKWSEGNDAKPELGYK